MTGSCKLQRRIKNRGQKGEKPQTARTTFGDSIFCLNLSFNL